MAEDTATVWQDIELRIDPETFCLNIMPDIFNEQKFHIQKSIETKGTFQVGFMDIVTETAPIF